MTATFPETIGHTATVPLEPAAWSAGRDYLSG